MTTFTHDDLPVAYRDASAIALAGARRDGVGIAALWNGSPNQPALIYAMARLPSLLMRAGANSAGSDVDAVAALEAIVRGMPTSIDDLTPYEEDKTDD